MYPADEIAMLHTALEAAQAELAEARAGQTYRYIGKDGKSVLARDLEDDRDRLAALVKEAVEGLQMIAHRKNNSTWDACNHARATLAKLEGKG